MAGNSDKYNPKTDVYMGGVLQNLGYITPEQRTKTDALDALAIQLGKNNPEFKKPFYGQIAGGSGEQKIVDEMNAQIASGKLKADNPAKLAVEKNQGVELSIKGEKSGADLEREGGPIKNALKVQKELRELERMNLLPETASEMEETTVKIANRLNLDYPERQHSPERFEGKMDLDNMLRRAIEGGHTKINFEHVEQRIQ